MPLTARILRQKCRVREDSKIKELFVPGVHKNPFGE
jgi:hypothetical protein